jgi:hypothetical protein
VREHGGEQQHYLHSVLLLYGLCESDYGGEICGICGLYVSGCDCGGEICGICGLYVSGCDCGGDCGGEICGFCESGGGYGICGIYVSDCGGEICGICGLYESGCDCGGDCGGEICGFCESGGGYGICGIYVSDCGGEICGICGLYVNESVNVSEIYVFLDLFYFCNLYVQFFCDHIYSVNENENDYESFYII